MLLLVEIQITSIIFGMCKQVSTFTWKVSREIKLRNQICFITYRNAHSSIFGIFLFVSPRNLKNYRCVLHQGGTTLAEIAWLIDLSRNTRVYSPLNSQTLSGKHPKNQALESISLWLHLHWNILNFFERWRLKEIDYLKKEIWYFNMFYFLTKWKLKEFFDWDELFKLIF